MYAHGEIEKKVAAFWEKHKTYEKLKAAGAGRPKFFFCDGPPYATGQIHPGTAWNKCLKDAVCRYKRMRGFDVRSQPGFDTHGLPIEVKVEQELMFSSKKDIEKYGVEEFIAKCREFATKYIGVMGSQFQNLGVWMDWEAPYLTYKDEFIERSWKTVKQAEQKGLLERGVYVLPTCPRCETPVANSELEYGDESGPSTYFKLKVKGEKSTFLLIWTTTPWTLPGNLAVMAHPDFSYVKVKADGEYWILAKERLAAVSAIANPLGLECAVIEEFSGKKLEGLAYEHPLADEVPEHKGKEFSSFHKVILNKEFVTLEEGTGLVHTAPGHGPQDFEAGKAAGIPPFSPVNAAGRYTKAAGKYAGLKVFEANPRIIADMKEKGLLLNESKITHRYPHCWRCKTPLIFIVTDQWFIKVSKMRDTMLAEIDRSSWQPPHAKTWFKDFVSNAPDWCISRQRYWGIPLPIWACEKKACGKMRVFGSQAELEAAAGRKLHNLHKPQMDAVEFACECGGAMKRVPDVLDVWFDSGNAIWASMDEAEFKKWYPCDFITEGKDQIRGWFYSLLGSGVIAYGEIPYRGLLMHGFFVDEKGEKMSKSAGNFVPLEQITEKHGADAFRLWSLSSVVWDDLKFNWDEIKDASRALGIFWNVHVFLERAAAAEGFDPQKARLVEKELDMEDLWLLSRRNTLIAEYCKAMDCGAVHEASRRVREFVVEDVSRLYLKLAKKRLADGRHAKTLLKIMYDSLLTAVQLSAPFTPFIAEEIYQNSFRKHEGPESVFLLPFPQHDPGRMDANLENQMAAAVGVASLAANARQTANVKLRWPLEEAVIATSSTDLRTALERLPFVVEMLANVKKVRVEEKSPVSLAFIPNKNRIGAAFKQKSSAVIAKLQALEPEELRAALADGKFELAVENYKFPITPDMVEFTETAPAGYALASAPEYTVLVKTAANEELYAEALRREVARRIQLMRKELGLVEKDEIEAHVSASAEFIATLQKQEADLAREVNASTLRLQAGGVLKGAKAWQIEDEDVLIDVRKKHA